MRSAIFAPSQPVRNAARTALASERPVPTQPYHPWWQIGVLVLLVGWLYSSILIRLAKQWLDDPNFSHGFLVPALSLFVFWRDRTKFTQALRSPSSQGLMIVILALAVLVTGVLGAELFLSRVSLLLLIAGVTIYFEGWARFRTVLFPWAFLFLMIPVPAIVMNQIAFPLQLLASKAASFILVVFEVPVLREGNIIHLPATSLDVAEACSGIRSLLSLITLSIIFSYLFERRVWIRILLAVVSIPIAVFVNSLRIVGTGLLVQYWDPERALGFFHTFSGWLVFLASVGVLLLLQKLLSLVSAHFQDAR